jgi:hypothetical protein
VRLQPATQSDMKLGKIVVFRASHKHARLEMRIIQTLGEDNISLAVLSPLIEDDRENESLPTSSVESQLLMPVIERGDRVRFHGRRATISETFSNDTHVRIRLDETPTQEIYTNIALLDFAEELERAALESNATASTTAKEI